MEKLLNTSNGTNSTQAHKAAAGLATSYSPSTSLSNLGSANQLAFSPSAAYQACLFENPKTAENAYQLKTMPIKNKSFSSKPNHTCISLLAVVLWLACSSAQAFPYPVTESLKVVGNSSLTTNVVRKELYDRPNSTWVPEGYIMQPAQWLGNNPSVIYAQTPISNCTWFCIRSTGETLQDFTKRWNYTSWNSSLSVDPSKGPVCSGVIIRGDTGTGVVTSLWYAPPVNVNGCFYPDNSCYFSTDSATLNHGTLTDVNANNHQASTSIQMDCTTSTYATFKLKNGYDSQRIALSNGGKSKISIDGKNLGIKLKIPRGQSTYSLSDTLEMSSDVEPGPFSGNAVLQIMVE